MTNAHLQFLDYLADKGVAFAVKGGGSNYWVSPEDIELYLEDPDALFAERNGVTKEQYRDWVEDGFVARCAATLRSGKPCTRPVETYGRHSAQEYVAHQGEYCTRHNDRA